MSFPPTFEAHCEGYEISTDPARLDIAAIHDFLANRSYWAFGIPRSVVEKSIQNSLSFGVYSAGKQVGFARIVSDYATFAFIADVFILEEYRGRGLSKWLMECVTGHPELQGLRRWSLMTKDAHGLYARYGFQPMTHPERAMEIANPHVYLSSSQDSTGSGPTG